MCKMINFLEYRWTKNDDCSKITTKFKNSNFRELTTKVFSSTGICYLEKLETAWNQLRKHKKDYQSFKFTNARCIEKLRSAITNTKEQSVIKKLFGVYDQCIREDCFLEDIVSRTLKQHETFLFQESTSCANWMKKN